jgi:hypothetical protein
MNSDITMENQPGFEVCCSMAVREILVHLPQANPLFDK